MIRYTLKCTDGHAFESWFQSADRYDELRQAGHVSCPDCGSAEVEKSLMAPQVQAARKKSEAEPAENMPAPVDPREKALTELRAHVEANSDYVGLNFAAEARSMHEGRAPERSIYGEAKLGEAKKLIEEGIPVAPLPFIPKAKTH